MPITYRVDVEHRVVLATANGVLTDADLLVHLGTLTTDPDVQPGFNELYNLRDMVVVEITASSVEDVRGFIHQIEQHFKDSKTAIVASDHNTAEVSYLFELLRTNVSAEVQLFHDLVAAREWLGLRDARKAPRKQVSFVVVCRAGIREAPAHLVNLSLSGALMKSELLQPERGRMVTIQFPHFEVLATVVRHTENGIAIDFLGRPDELAEMLRD